MIYALRTGWCDLESVDTEIKHLELIDVSDGTRNRWFYFGGDLYHCLGPEIFYHYTHKQYWGCWALAEVCALKVLLFIILQFMVRYNKCVQWEASNA